MNNRIIKFRAWDSSQRDMVDWDGITGHGSTMFMFMMQRNPYYHLMQFTGIVDKNKTEIYEGDIIKWDDMSKGAYWRVAVCEWCKNGCFGYRIVKNTLHELSTKEGYVFKSGNFIYSNGEELEVIGNIYENENLIIKSNKNDQ